MIHRPRPKSEFKRVQAAKLVHEMASGTHKRWGEGPGATELHVYPRSRGRVLRHVGKDIESAVELLVDHSALLAHDCAITQNRRLTMKEIVARHSGTHVVIHTQGACIGSRGPGGWAAILQLMEGPKQIKKGSLKGSSPTTTNNQMELTAAIEALKKVTSGNPVFVLCDSEYVVKGINERVPNWKAGGWLKTDKKPVVNRVLWEELDVLTTSRLVTWEWVSGKDHPITKEVDRLAKEAARIDSLGMRSGSNPPAAQPS